MNTSRSPVFRGTPRTASACAPTTMNLTRRAARHAINSFQCREPAAVVERERRVTDYSYRVEPFRSARPMPTLSVFQFDGLMGHEPDPSADSKEHRRTNGTLGAGESPLDLLL